MQRYGQGQKDDWYREDESGESTTWDEYDEFEDNLNVQLEDLPLEDEGEARSIVSVLAEIVVHRIERLRQLKVSFTSSRGETDAEEDQCSFDLRMTDIPVDELPQKHVKTSSLRNNRLKMRRPRTILFSLILLLMSILLVNTVTPIHDRLASLLLVPTPVPTGQNPLSSYPGHLLDNPTNAAFEANKTTVVQMTSNGKQQYLYVPAPVPYECPTSVTLGSGRQVGTFPIWLSGFGAPNTVLHLPPTIVSNPKDFQGWVVNFRVQVKVRYTSLILLGIDDLNHLSTPLLRDPSNGTHVSRTIISPNTPKDIPNTGNKLVGSFDMSLYLPGAGCYIFSAAWQEGSWEVIFAAGK